MNRRLSGRRVAAAFALTAVIAGACGGPTTDPSIDASPTATSSTDTAGPTATAGPTDTAGPTATAGPTDTAGPPPTSTTPPCATPPTGEDSTEFRGRIRPYTVVAPDVIEPNTPLLLLLHGYTSNPQRILRHSELEVAAPDAGVVVVAPLATGEPSSWEIIPPNDPDDPAYTGPDDLGFLTQLVEDLRDEHPCLGPVWAAGLSAGSAMAGFYMCSEPDALVGVGLVAALIPAVCEPGVVTEMLIFHGTDDIVVSYTGGEQAVDDGSFALPGIETSAAAWADLAECGPLDVVRLSDAVELRSFPECVEGAAVTLHTYDGGNHNWPGGTDDQLPPVVDDLPVTCVLLHRITAAPGDVYEACLR